MAEYKGVQVAVAIMAGVEKRAEAERMVTCVGGLESRVEAEVPTLERT
jgi:hypothetical protein